MTASSAPPRPPTVSTTSAYLIALAILVPHVAIGYWYFGLRIRPAEIPTPLDSLLVVLALSVVVSFVIRPLLLDALVSASTTSTARVSAEWTWLNVQWPSLIALWTWVLLDKWPGPAKDDLYGCMAGSVALGLTMWGFHNIVQNDTELEHPASPRRLKQAADKKAKQQEEAAAAALRQPATGKA